MVVLVSIQGAYATSIMGTALSYEKRAKAIGGVSDVLSVYVDGSVVHRTISPQLPHGGAAGRLVVRLTAEQMDKIYRLIKKASKKPVLITFKASGVRCFAPASHIEKYTAVNRSVFLKEGAACDGGYRINVKNAARTLTYVLGVLENAAHTRLSVAEIERQVDQALAL